MKNNNEIDNLRHNSNETDQWKNEIPIAPVELKTMKDEEILNWINHLALSAYNQKNEKDLIKFLYAYAEYPIIKPWIKVIKREYYLSWLKLDQFKGLQWVVKHLLKSIITTMGHMKATWQGIQSTNKERR